MQKAFPKSIIFKDCEVVSAFVNVKKVLIGSTDKKSCLSQMSLSEIQLKLVKQVV